VHDIAEELEHIKSEELVNRLDAYLDYPKFDPHGDPIPNAQGKFTLRNQMSLSAALPGNKVVLLGVREHETSFLEYLNELNIGLGTEFTIKAFNNFDKSMNILVDHIKETLLSEKVCQILLVKKI
jgi:DtxR family Mn-dependent transcriptional regulator